MRFLVLSRRLLRVNGRQPGVGADKKGAGHGVDMGAKRWRVDGRVTDHIHGKGQGTFLEERPQPVANRRTSAAVEQQVQVGIRAVPAGGLPKVLTWSTGAVIPD